MYKSRTLVGISLKKISGKEAKWEEYNIEKLSLDEIDEYKYTDINFLIDFSENMNQDTTVFLKPILVERDISFRSKQILLLSLVI